MKTISISKCRLQVVVIIIAFDDRNVNFFLGFTHIIIISTLLLLPFFFFSVCSRCVYIFCVLMVNAQNDFALTNEHMIAVQW